MSSDALTPALSHREREKTKRQRGQNHIPDKALAPHPGRVDAALIDVFQGSARCQARN
jgi:hypothetical protein